jgi:hypothetical protein
MLSIELLDELSVSLQNRRIQAGIALLDEHKSDFAAVIPEHCFGGTAIGSAPISKLPDWLPDHWKLPQNAPITNL